MRIEFEVSNSELNQSDLNVILQSLNVTDKSKVPEILSKIAKCAVLEYRKMFIERGLPTKAAEVMQERLFYLIKGYFKDHLPKEQEISSIFQLTPSGAKTLLKNTISRYRIYLKDEIGCSIKTVLQDFSEDKGIVTLVIQSSALKDEINNYLIFDTVFCYLLFPGTISIIKKSSFNIWIFDLTTTLCVVIFVCTFITFILSLLQNISIIKRRCEIFKNNF